MKRSSLLLLLLPVLMLVGCNETILQSTPAEIVPTPEVTMVESRSTIQNSLSNDALQTVNNTYNSGYILSNSLQLGDFFITEINKNSIEYGIIEQVIMGKVNGKRLSFYEGNSGEISCKIITDFGFPQKLLEAYGTTCTEGADYTIPQKTLDEFKTSMQN